MEYQKPQIEVVVFNAKKRTSDKSPTKTGTITFNEEFHFSPGDKLDLAVWNRTSKAGLSYESGIAKLPDPKFAKAPYAPKKSGGIEMVDF